MAIAARVLSDKVQYIMTNQKKNLLGEISLLIRLLFNLINIETLVNDKESFCKI